MRNRVAVDSQAFAQMSKAFVISACGTVDEPMIRMLKPGPEGEKFLRNPDCCGGSTIVAPNSRIVAGPMGAEEGILYADCNIEIGIQMKLRHDFAGHYNRPDVFQLQINRAAPRIYAVYGENGNVSLGVPGQPELPGMAGAIADASNASNAQAAAWRAVEAPRGESAPDAETKK
jgi:aliphatic nitrilase